MKASNKIALVFLSTFVALMFVARTSNAETKDETANPEAAKISIDGFQKAKFGSEYATVLKLYPKATNKKKNGKLSSFQIPKFELAGSTGLAELSFVNGKLYRVGFIFPLTGNGENAYESEFDKMTDLLRKKYGEPTKLVQPRRDIAGTDMTRLSLMSGQITWVAQWIDESAKSQITMGITKGIIGLSYDSVELLELAKKADSDQKANEL